MRRRDFVTLIGGAAAAWPLAGRAQPAGKVPTIGFLGTDTSGYISSLAAFAERLKELGWIEGRTVAIEYRWSEGRPERVAEIAAEFVQKKVDLIVAYGAAVTTLKKATASILIIFAPAVDPVGVGLVASFSHRAGTSRDSPSRRPRLPVSGSNFYVTSFPNLAGWESCLMSTTLQPCGRRAKFRLWLARSASKSCHKRYGERRISHPRSTLSKAKWTHFM